MKDFTLYNTQIRCCFDFGCCLLLPTSESRTLKAKLDTIPMVSVDTSGKPAETSQPLITEIKVVDTTQKDIAVVERPVDSVTNIKDPAFLDMTDTKYMPVLIILRI